VPIRSAASGRGLENEKGWRAVRPSSERATEKPGELAPEEVVEARTGAQLIRLDQALERGTVLEKTWRSASVPNAGSTCGVHVPAIGAERAQFDPWRE
jgi:hypothetical protein